MFRFVMDIQELNIDQMKLPPIPGLGMIKRMPNAQKLQMLVTSVNTQKGMLIPKLEEEASKKWGYLRIHDLAAETPNDGNILLRLQIDIAEADYDKAIDTLLPALFQPQDVIPVLGDQYTGPSDTPSVITYMHQAPGTAQKEFYLVKSLSTEKQTLCQRIEFAASTQGAVLRIHALRFLLKQN